MADITNISRLLLELKGFNEGFNEDIDQVELGIRLEENGLIATDKYDTQSKSNLKKIYQTALSVLEGIANNPKSMKNYKTEDLTITHFQTNLMNRIDDLRKKINSMADDDFRSENDTRIIPFIW